jgi:hypothetical protein
VQYSAVQCSTVQYSAVQCSTVQYSAVQCTTAGCLISLPTWSTPPLYSALPWPTLPAKNSSRPDGTTAGLNDAYVSLASASWPEKYGAATTSRPGRWQAAPLCGIKAKSPGRPALCDKPKCVTCRERHRQRSTNAFVMMSGVWHLFRVKMRHLVVRPQAEEHD